jgi:hypothetical protein
LSNMGSKYSSKPDMPEVFLGEYYRDPNSLMYSPDMSAMDKQQYWRFSRYKELGKDADHSIPDKLRTGARIDKDRRDAFHLTQMRLKNFSTSYGNMTGHGFRAPLTDGISQVTMVNAELNPEMGTLNDTARSNHTVMSSNTYPSGWQESPDHVWKVAEYGAKPYSKLATSKYNQQKSNHYSLEDHDPVIEFKGSFIPKSLVVLKKRHHSEFIKHDNSKNILPFERKAPIRQKVQMKQGVRPQDGILDHKAGKSLAMFVGKRREHVDGKAIEMIDSDGKMGESLEGFSNKKQRKMGNNRKALNNAKSDGKMGESATTINYSNKAPIRVNNHNGKLDMKFTDANIIHNRKVLKHSDNVRVTDYSHKFGESNGERPKSGNRRDLRKNTQKMSDTDMSFREEGSQWRSNRSRFNKNNSSLSYRAELDNRNYINDSTG